MTAVFAFLLMLLIVAGMSVGVMLGRKPIAGSCGGVKALGLDTECEVCGGDPDACDGGSSRKLSPRQIEAASLGSDAAAPPRRRDVRTL